MWKLLLVLAVLSLAVGCAAVEGQAHLGIFAETSVFRMNIAMPEMPDMPQGVDLSAMPGMEMLSGKPTRALKIRLWSPGIAPQDAFAYVQPPAGLKLGNKLDLELYRPKPSSGSGTSGNGESGDMSKLTIKVYWGCSPTVRQGQPKVIQFGSLSPAEQERMKSAAKRMESYYYKPDWTTGYWPNEMKPVKVAMDASMVGTYKLTTNYTGSVSIDAPSNVTFLAPFDLSSPAKGKPIDLTKSIDLAWAQIPNILGQHAVVFGMEGQNTIIIWSSSENYTDQYMGMMDYMQMAEVRQLVTQQVMMGPTKTSCSVPSGIFAKCDAPMLMMVGYGPGAALDTGNPLPRIQTKTLLTMMLKMPAGMGDDGNAE